MRDCKYQYGCVCTCPNLDVYLYSYAYLSKYKLPVVKKKSFEILDNNSWSTLSYIKFHTKYDIKFILDHINMIYGHDICEENIKRLDSYDLPVENRVAMPYHTEEEVEKCLAEHCFYIYGVGMYGFKTYWRFAKNNSRFLGFVISDDRESEKELFGYPVLHYSEIKFDTNIKIILGLGPENTMDVLKKIRDIENIIRIF